MDKLKVLAADPDFTSARHADLVLQFWHRETSSLGVSAFREAVATVCSQTPVGCRVLVVVEPLAGLPSREARNEIAAVMQEYKDRIRAAALAFEATGFKSASIRAVVTGLNLLSQHPFPYRVFSSIPAALAWDPMAPPGLTHSALNVCRAIRAMRGDGLPIAS